MLEKRYYSIRCHDKDKSKTKFKKALSAQNSATVLQTGSSSLTCKSARPHLKCCCRLWAGTSRYQLLPLDRMYTTSSVSNRGRPCSVRPTRPVDLVKRCSIFVHSLWPTQGECSQDLFSLNPAADFRHRSTKWSSKEDLAPFKKVGNALVTRLGLQCQHPRRGGESPALRASLALLAVALQRCESKIKLIKLCNRTSRGAAGLGPRHSRTKGVQRDTGVKARRYFLLADGALLFNDARLRSSNTLIISRNATFVDENRQKLLGLR
ncbi:hypothetical protein EVAR_74500_1 [Eumeta japonica]|uniref:Uncharacterized protein n=1 Tax=Eumeta variegata TaxID=151549 RepID=A0A4C1TE58_EUMVA|nr:hypothetical protein EVAR_74500_1 [Eumeta japonica]